MKGKPKTMSVISSVVIGVLIAIAIVLLVSGISSALILGQYLDENTGHVVASIAVLIASLAGSVVAGKLSKSKYGIVCGAIILAILLLQIGINIIFFDGAFSGFVRNGIILTVTGSFSCILLMKGRKGNRHR